MYTTISKCRICGNPNLVPIVELGEQMLTGVFPKSRDEKITKGPLTLVKCMGDAVDTCGLVQLSQSYDLSELYGHNYGYRSGLNKGMVAHLHGKVDRIMSIARLDKGDLIIDIGSNDSTTLQAYPAGEYALVGVDPTGVKFRDYYPPHIGLIADFFSAALVKQKYGGRKAKVVTSFSMFYDLERPMEFMKEIHGIIHDEGIWVFEQSYLPAMLETNSYDTICHEHLEYYALRQIKWMADRAGFKIIDIEFNDINGGSFSVTAAKKAASYGEYAFLKETMDKEATQKLDTLEPYRAFYERIAASKRELLEFIRGAKARGKKVYGLGASTKGNVLLQYCGITADDIEYVGEVNREKFGCYTPGTYIPIIPESELLEKNPDYLLVLPWHFRGFFVGGGKFKRYNLLFPLPRLEVVS